MKFMNNCISENNKQEMLFDFINCLCVFRTVIQINFNRIRSLLRTSNYQHVTRVNVTVFNAPVTSLHVPYFPSCTLALFTPQFKKRSSSFPKYRPYSHRRVADDTPQSLQNFN